MFNLCVFISSLYKIEIQMLWHGFITMLRIICINFLLKKIILYIVCDD